MPMLGRGHEPIVAIQLELIPTVLLRATATGAEDAPPRRHRLTADNKAGAEGPEIATTRGERFLQPMLGRRESAACIHEPPTLASLRLPDIQVIGHVTYLRQHRRVQLLAVEFAREGFPTQGRLQRIDQAE